jgi:hypothetical protein
MAQAPIRSEGFAKMLQGREEVEWCDYKNVVDLKKPSLCAEMKKPS